MNFHLKQILKKHKKCFDLQRSCYCHALYLHFTVFVCLIFHFCLHTYVLIWYVLFNFIETHGSQFSYWTKHGTTKTSSKETDWCSTTMYGENGSHFIACYHFRRATCKERRDQIETRWEVSKNEPVTVTGL